MSGVVPHGQAFNQTRQRYLATELAVADTHWSRLRGLLGASEAEFLDGGGLWIRPCRGVHTLGMRFAIDVVYLDSSGTVIHIEHNLQPWRFAPVRVQARSVLELPPHTASSTGTVLGDRIEIKMRSGGSIAAGIPPGINPEDVNREKETHA
jgi:uncharacterized membrane protein (UPF0127 family)